MKPHAQPAPGSQERPTVGVAPSIRERKPARLLCFTRSAGYVHEVVRRRGNSLAYVETMLAQLGQQCGVEVVATKDGGVFDDDLSGYDAFAFYTLGEITRSSGEQTPPMSHRGKRRLLAAVASGKGFLGFHAACDTFLSHNGQVDPYIAMLGGEFITHDRVQPSTLRSVAPDFPGMAGLGSTMTLFEEWYALKNFAADLHVILVQQTDDMVGECYRRQPYPATWARRYGAGRVFYTSLGHEANVWRDRRFQQIATGGMAFVLGQVDADLTPNLDRFAPAADQWPREHVFCHLATLAETAAV